MWDLVLLRRIRYPLLADDKQKKGKVPTLPPKSPIDLRSSSFAPRHSLQAHSALGLSSVDNVGLGPATQDKISTFV